MKEYKKRILITGCCGFIGSNAFEYFAEKYPEYRIIGYDSMTYCANLNNISDVLNKYDNTTFIIGDICDSSVYDILKEYKVDSIINFAAESHVDNSLKNSFVFAKTNVLGTLNLLEAARRYWSEVDATFKNNLFYHISTDEVFGSLESVNDEPFKETNLYKPNSPYSASKASSDHFVRAYHVSYKLPTVVSHCSNNYGPKQFNEKLIPKVLSCLVEKKNIPLYGTGMNIRDWIYVGDHVDAIDLLFHKGVSGETYNIGGHHEESNVNIIKQIINAFAYYTTKGTSKDIETKVKELSKLVTYVPDRLGHDFRYAIDSSKIYDAFGWYPKTNFNEGLKNTVKWYLENKEFLPLSS